MASRIYGRRSLCRWLQGCLIRRQAHRSGIWPRIATYRQVGDKSGSFDTIVALAHEHGIAAEDNRHPAVNRNDRLVLLVGWQFNYATGSTVASCSTTRPCRAIARIFTHGDGAARWSGTPGVSAIQPVEEADTGAIYGSRSIAVPPGTSLKIALELQVRDGRSGLEDLARIASGTLAGRPQDQAQPPTVYGGTATTTSSTGGSKRKRSFAGCTPGARGRERRQRRVLTIEQAAIGPELSFTLHDPGKLWQIADYRALVVCGAGTLWIERASDFSQPLPLQISAFAVLNR